MTKTANKQITQAYVQTRGHAPASVTLVHNCPQPGWYADGEYLGRNLQEALITLTGRRNVWGSNGEAWTSKEGWVYLLHFDHPIGSDKQKAQHYLGYTSKENVDERLTKHQLGVGAALPNEAYRQGIGFTLVRKWRGNRQLEKKLKNHGHLPRLCWICQHAGKGQDKRSKYYKALLNMEK